MQHNLNAKQTSLLYSRKDLYLPIAMVVSAPIQSGVVVWCVST